MTILPVLAGFEGMCLLAGPQPQSSELSFFSTARHGCPSDSQALGGGTGAPPDLNEPGRKQTREKRQTPGYNKQQVKWSTEVNAFILTPAVSMWRRTGSCSLKGASFSDKILITESLSTHGSISRIVMRSALGEIRWNFSHKRSTNRDFPIDGRQH